MQRKKLLLGIVTLAMLIASVILAFATNIPGVSKAFGIFDHAQSNSVTTTDFSVPAGSDPWGTAFDKNGQVWVALPGCDPSPTCATGTPPGTLAVFNPASQSWTHIYNLPSGFAQPLYLAFDRQGRVWFPMPMNNSIGMFNPANNSFQQWAVPTPSAGPWDVAIDGNGNVWFTEHFVNKIGMFNPANQTFHEIATPSNASQPYGIVVDGSNNVWFTENNAAVALIGEYTAQGQLKEYKIRNGSTSNLTPHLITIDPNGNIWWSEGWVAMIGELKIAQAQAGTNNGVTEYAYPLFCSSCATHTSGISADSNGTIWFDDSLQNAFGSFSDTGTGSFALYGTPTSAGHPHDGLNVDAQHRVWFDEEFVNKLALAIPPTSSVTPPPTTVPSPTPTSTPGSGSVLGQDTFKRANQALWGQASDGQTWGGDANANNVFSIANNAGNIAGSGLYSAVLGPTATDSEVLMSGSISQFSGANFGAVVRWADTNDWYKAYIDSSNLMLQRKVKGNVTTLGQTPFTATAGTSYTIRFRVVGTLLYAKVWASNSTEPSNWMVTASDSSLVSGYSGVRAQTQSGSIASYTSFVATTISAGGSSTPTPTPTSTTVPSPTPTSTSSSGSGSVLGQDTFKRANQALWGQASDGQTWGGDANANNVFSIANNAGNIAGSGLYSAVLGPTATDSEVLMSGSISQFSGANFGAVVRWTDTNDWYKAYIDGSNLMLQRKVKGNVTTLGQTPFTATAGTSYTIRFRVVGTLLYAKVWASNGTEPSNWMVTASDSSLVSGYSGVRAQTQSGSIASYTSFVATTISVTGGSTPTPTPTPTSSPSATPSPSPTASVTPTVTATATPPTGSTIAQDSFQHANQPFWGTASDGQVWGGDANNVSNFSIVNNAGVLVGNGNNYSAVLGPSVTDAQVLMTGSIDYFNNSNFGAVLRWTNGNNWYKAYIDGANLVIQKKINGNPTNLAVVPFAASAGTSYSLRFQIIGTTLSAKVWASNSPEPTNWTATASDTTFKSGYCGLRALAQGGSTVTYTAFIATQLP